MIRKKRSDQKSPAVEDETVEPEVTLIPEIISDQVSEASTPVLPNTEGQATDTPQLATSTTPGVIPVPILEKTIKSTSKSIPSESTSKEATQTRTPQLPPT